MTTLTASTTVLPTTGVLRPGLKAAAVAAVATTAFAAVTHAAGVSYAIKGEAIPVLGFGQLTFAFSLVGVALAAVLARRARHAQSTFIRATVGLTLLSFIPDITAQASSATRLSLMLAHVIAAAIVIPQLAARLSD
ncbi:MAG: hypothetical protein QOG90_2124 [Actinomycetota bacterium]|jgi:hypothetical protein